MEPRSDRELHRESVRGGRCVDVGSGRDGRWLLTGVFSASSLCLALTIPTGMVPAISQRSIL